MEDKVCLYEIKRNIKLKQNLLRYLDLNQVLQHLYSYLNDNFKVNKAEIRVYTFFLPVKIDLSILTEFSSDLSYELIHNPYNFKNILREIVHIVVCEILRTEEIDEYQILTPVLPESFPVDNLIVLKGLSTFRGILIEIGDSEKYTRNSVWMCECQEKYEFFETPTVFFQPKCTKCDKNMEEFVAARNSGELHPCELVEVEALMMKRTGRRYQTLRCLIPDFVIKDLELGVAYELIGLQVCGKEFEVWNCKKLIEISPIDDLSLTNTSPWMKVFSLAFELGGRPGKWIGPLLSLAAVRAGIPSAVMIIGNDTLISHRLFNDLGCYARRFVTPCMGIETNRAMVLARDGVCYLGDWCKYQNNKEGAVVLSAIESGCVELDGRRMDLSCAVWSYWGGGKTPNDYRHLQSLIKVFGVGFVVEQSDEEAVSELLDEMKISSSYSRNVHQAIQSCVVGVEVETKAERLLGDYFVASRCVRPDLLPLSALKWLHTVTASWAGLSQRERATIYDATAAVALCEYTLRYFHKSDDNESPLCISKIKNPNDVDEMFFKFYYWLEKFICNKKI